jgi:hypothetical protein
MSAKQKKIAWPMLCLVIAVAATALVFATTRHGRTAPSSSSNDDSSSRGTSAFSASRGTSEMTSGSAVQASVRGPIQNVRFTVYDVGIYPRQCRVGSGLVSISIEDRTGSSTGLLIERIDGNALVPIGRVTRVTNELRGRLRLRLEPGRYRISDSNPQSTKAELTVEP